MKKSTMRRNRAAHVILIAVALLSAPGCSSTVIHELGVAPMCEASAALPAPWNRALVLVADNETSSRIFVFHLDEYGLLSSQEELPLPGAKRPADIEAMAVMHGQLVLVGSHGRSGGCKPRPERQRIQILGWNPDSGGLELSSLIDTSEQWQGRVTDHRACMRGLFVAPPPTGAAQLCHALVKAEQTGRARACGTLDIEGAAATTESDSSRLWLGLRQPRVGERSVLVRLADGLDDLRFDSVVLIDAPRGVRALEARGDWLWLILGPKAPSFKTSCLIRVRLDHLVSGAVLEGEIMVDGLPPNSEAMVFDNKTVFVLTDGNEALSQLKPCATPAGQLRFDLTRRLGHTD